MTDPPRPAIIDSRCTRSRRIPFIGAGLVFLKGFGSDVMVGAPINRLIELTVCRRYYLARDPTKVAHDGSVDEQLCKVVSVQEQLALILGAAGFLSPLIELLVSLPFGVYADKRGRKQVLILNVVAGVCYYGWVVAICLLYHKFHPNYIILCALFYLIGGGPNMFSAMIFASIADVNSHESRTQAFYRLQCVVQIVQILAPVAGSLLLSAGIWTPFYLGIAFQLCQFILIYFIPGGKASQLPPRSACRSPTSPCNAHASTNGCPCAPTAADQAIDELYLIRNNSNHVKSVLTSDASSVKSRNVKRLVDNMKSDVSELFRLFTYDRQMTCSLLAFFVTNLGRGFVGVLLQYTSNRYGWSFAQAGYLLSLKTILTIILFLVILPKITAYLIYRHGLPIEEINLLVAKGSIFMLILGCVLVGAASTVEALILGLVVVSGGFGFGAAMQSLITSLVPVDKTARLYSGISVLETIGAMVSHPLLSSALAAGIQVGGAALGLPFFICAALYVISAVPVFSMQLKHKERVISERTSLLHAMEE